MLYNSNKYSETAYIYIKCYYKETCKSIDIIDSSGEKNKIADAKRIYRYYNILYIILLSLINNKSRFEMKITYISTSLYN